MASKPAYRPSPAAPARYPWVNKPDTKFANGGAGTFKTDQYLTGQDALAFKSSIDPLVEAAFAEEMENIAPKERPKWSKFYPYEEELDDDGKPTGAIIAKFRQNAEIKVEGVSKPVRISIFNAKDEPKDIPVFGGDIIRVMYKPRTIKMQSSKQVGIRLDFAKVQVVRKAERGSGPGGFGEVEGGYTGEDDEVPGGGFGGAAGADTSGDY